MTETRRLYFEWLTSFVYDDKLYVGLSYRRLLEYLHERDFYYIIPMDENRELDGIALRYRFAELEGYSVDSMEFQEITNRRCSILEMMVALSIRMEEAIMSDPAIGNRTGQWFWTMIVSLGLADMTDRDFDIYKVNNSLYKLLNREYMPNGAGGLFTLKNPGRDMRFVEIWYQMQGYLLEVG